jgi:hypothetical protein
LGYVKRKMRWGSLENVGSLRGFLSVIWSVYWVEFVDYETSVFWGILSAVLKKGYEIWV